MMINEFIAPLIIKQW